jgi:two-component sensor histidine kinase
MSFDKASLRDYVRGYNQMIQEVARQTNKEVAELETDLEYHHFDSVMLARINDIILHCLRNAIDHGIESKQERQLLGKQEAGKIRLSTREEDGVAYIEISDNGRGIDIDKVKKKAVDLGLLKSIDAERMTDSETLPYLFHPGVSTAATVTEISGRGLGMDIVRDYVQSLNGQISISFHKGEGTTFAMWIPTANQEYLTPLAVYDLRDLVSEVIRDFPRFEEIDVVPLREGAGHRMILFCDRLSITEILRRAFQEMYHHIPGQSKIRIELREFLGRRRVDSYNFFRIKFGAFEDIAGLPAKEDTSHVLEQAGNLARKAGGSLFVHHPYWIELNLPSNIPMHYADYEFQVLVFMNRITNLGHHVETFFSHVMGGWKYRVYFAPFTTSLPPELTDAPCLVLLDSVEIPTYMKIRAESDRIKDGVVLFPERDLDVDILNESAILPENLLFVPPSFDEKHLHRCLAGVIFRRFLRDMVREPAKAEEDDVLSGLNRAS